MISYDQKRFANVPPSLNSPTTLNLLTEVIGKAPNHQITRGYNAPDVKATLRAYFGDKCVFCETISIASSSFRVDHFRPKKYVDGELPTVHYGYYWLCLEWTNLLQTCEHCNRSKSNQFPVSKGRVNAQINAIHIDPQYRFIHQSPLKDEECLLLHPELDTVEQHLRFNPDGRVSPINNSLKGEKSIEVYGLNRGDLVLVRKRRIDHHFNELVHLLNKFEDGGATKFAKGILANDLTEFFRRLLLEQDEEKEYSRLAYYMFHDFEHFFIDRLAKHKLPELEDLLRKIYQRIKALT